MQHFGAQMSFWGLFRLFIALLVDLGLFLVDLDAHSKELLGTKCILEEFAHLQRYVYMRLQDGLCE
jgi:hypothetical protein